MFTGIIESLGTVKNIRKTDGNLDITIESAMASELRIDQSVSHNGICLTVVDIHPGNYVVTAINETIQKTNIGSWKPGDLVNLERAMKIGDRLDGHIVQGHVDQIGICKKILTSNGSWIYSFEYDRSQNNLTIEKGSVTVNGVSLTVVNSQVNTFEVAVIPYTYEHTNFKTLKTNDPVNLEFDVLGKYVSKLLAIK